MSDILPKFRLYLFCAFFTIIINIAIMISSLNFSLINVLGFSVGSFIPFISIFNLGYTGYPIELNILLGTIIGIFSVIELFLILMFGFQTIHNVIWNPDV